MNAVGPRQTACRLLPIQIPAKMVTDKNDDYDEDDDDDVADDDKKLWAWTCIGIYT